MENSQTIIMPRVTAAVVQDWSDLCSWITPFCIKYVLYEMHWIASLQQLLVASCELFIWSQQSYFLQDKELVICEHTGVGSISYTHFYNRNTANSTYKVYEALVPQANKVHVISMLLLVHCYWIPMELNSTCELAFLSGALQIHDTLNIWWFDQSKYSQKTLIASEGDLFHVYTHVWIWCIF